MATTYNIVEKRYNGTDYDTLYPATKGENLVSPVPVELGGTGGTTGAAGMKNLIDALSTVTPTGTDLLPLKDVSGNIAGKATVDSILSLVSGGAKIQTGSYVGTGTYGQANPCSLTFDFVPSLIVIYCQPYRTESTTTLAPVMTMRNNVTLCDKAWTSFSVTVTYSGGNTNTFALDGPVSYAIGNITSWYLYPEFFIGQPGMTWTGVTINSGASAQMNDANRTYYYVAFG